MELDGLKVPIQLLPISKNFENEKDISSYAQMKLEALYNTQRDSRTY